MSNEIILFDLPSRDQRAWSLNPWKARMVLNYKNLPYRTEWTEYPDIAPKFQALGIPPNPAERNPHAAYSIPVIRLPSSSSSSSSSADDGGRYVMDSLAIATELERLQPEPCLHLDTAYPARALEAVGLAQAGLRPILIPRVASQLLNPASEAYFRATRAQRWGTTLDELARSSEAGEKAWTAARPGLCAIRALLEEDAAGPYVMGERAGFADFVLAGFWRFAERVDREGDVFARLIGFDERFGRHYAACRPWLERDDR